MKVAAVSDHPDPGFHLDAERRALEWLAGTGIPAPAVEEYGSGCGVEWLVTRTVAGRSAADEWPEASRASVLRAVAEVARALHAVPVGSCPLDRRLVTRLAQIRTAPVDLADLDDRWRGWSAARLRAEAERTRPGFEDLAVCHGDLCLPNVLLDPATMDVTGLVDVARLGVADRYTDLALAVRSIGAGANPQYGASYVDRFLRWYGGVSRDDPRIGYYQLLDEFC